MSDCLFCKIVNGEIPSTKVYEDSNTIGFLDIYPQAKEHYLFISKKHTKNLSELLNDEEDLLYLLRAVKNFTNEKKLEDKGYRLVSNVGEKAGQSVFHTHLHILSGEQLGNFGK